MWDEAEVVASWPGLPALDGDAQADVCVVGLGASGLAAAEWAAEQGLSVVGIDAGRVANDAAGRNGGFLLGGAALWPHQLIDRWGLERATDVYRSTLAEIDRLADDLGPFVVRRTGSIRLAGVPGIVDPVEVEDADQHATALRSMGVTMDQIDTHLGPALFMADDCSINPALRCLLTAGTLVGRARLFEQTPALEIANGRVVTPAGVVSAGSVVICVDGGLENLVPALAGRVRTARLNVLATAPVEPVFPWPVYSRWGWDYFTQTPDGCLVVGGGRDLVGGDWVDESDAADGDVTDLVQSYLLGLAETVADGPVTITHRWVGHAAFTEDREPICEMVDERVAVAGAYSGVGNLVGPITARQACRLALG